MSSPPAWPEQPAWMSLWDKYLAPGDLRRRQQLQATPPPPPPPAPQDETNQTGRNQPPPTRIGSGQRVVRQNALLYGGLIFTTLSLLVTRRALTRKHVQIHPNTFTPSNGPAPKVDGGLEAIEALGLASLNVFSVAMATAGGLMTYFDVADLEDMRDKVRKGVGFDVYGGESEADKELEDWVADVLSRKDGQGDFKEGIAEKLAELAERDKREVERRRRDAGGR